MVNFLSYFFFRLTLYYNNQGSRFRMRLHAYIALCFCLLINQMTIEFFLFKEILNNTYFSYDKYIRRFIIAPLYALPIFLFVYIYYIVNRKKVEEKIKSFTNESIEESKRGKRYVFIYLLATVLLFLLSIVSPF